MAVADKRRVLTYWSRDDPDAFVRARVRHLEALRRAGHVERLDTDTRRVSATSIALPLCVAGVLPQTYVGGKEAVVALVERDGKVRSHQVPAVNAKTLCPILHAQIGRKSYLMTDESNV